MKCTSCSKLSTFANCQHFLNHPIHYQPPSPLQPLYLCFPFSCKLIEDRRETREGIEKVLSVQEASVQRKKRECNCESECKCRFERNECKSETLVFVGLYWVELSVCIIPPLIYNLLLPWMYPVLGNHVNLLVCVLFVFAFGPVCTTISSL